jgi:hypothetical protein
LRLFRALRFSQFLKKTFVLEWTLPQLVDRKTSMDYKQEGAEDGKKGHGAA